MRSRFALLFLASAMALPAAATTKVLLRTKHPVKRPPEPPANWRSAALLSAPKAFADRLSPGRFAMPHLFYYGGKILSSVKIVGVYWDKNNYFANDTIADTPSTPGGIKSALNGFYSAFSAGPLFGWIGEYDTNIAAVNNRQGTNQHFAPGQFVGGTVITPAVTTGALFGEDGIVAELKAQIANGKLPSPDANTLYQIHFAPGFTITDSDGTACQAYCAFHDWDTLNGTPLYFSVIPDHSPGSGCDQGCGDTTDWVSSLQSSASHETTEAMTDPEPGGNTACPAGPSWCDPADADYASDHDEIGDICEQPFANQSTQATFTTNTGQWTMQREWSNRYGACITTQPDAFSLTASPASVAVHGQGTYTFQITASSAANPGSAHLGTFDLPAGVSVQFSPATISPGGSSTMRVTVGGEVQPFSVMAFANSGPTLAYGLVSFTVDDFLVSSPAAQVSIKAGQSATIEIDTAPAAGSAQQQTLSIGLTGKPVGVIMSPSSVQVQAGQPATVSVTAQAGAPSLTNGSLTFTLSNSLKFKTLSVPFTLDGDDFAASTDTAAALNVPMGSATRFHLATQTAHGNAQPLTLVAKTVPAGMAVAFDKPQIQSGDTAVVTLTTNGAARQGQGALVITVQGPVNSTDVQLVTNILPGGCSSSGSAGAAGLALLLVWAVRSRRSLRL